MEKLKIGDLEVGKIYRFYYNDGILLRNIYMINTQGELYCEGGKYCKNKNGFSKSSLAYNTIINGYFVEFKREIDWSKVPRGTKVQVRDCEEWERWINAYFVEQTKSTTHPFRTSICLDDEFTGVTMEGNAHLWKYCRIHESVEILDEWYKEVE